ncbi:MAG: hypothetical protein JXA50_05535 [Deltaproteobacteria bacterium]|nr:hypothetical protein [Deltaproteobacteria bacterium]
MKEDRVREAYDEIDLYDYLRVIWRWRWMIAIGVIVATLISIPAACLVRSYESQGVLRVSEELKKEDSGSTSEKEGGEIIVTLPEYKIYSATFMESRPFLDYLKGQEVLPREGMASIIEKKLMAEPILEDYIQPLYAYSEQEMKIFHPTEQFISAVQLSWEGPSPELVQGVVDAMGLFVKDTLEKKVMERYVTQGYQEAYTQVQELENRLADLRFSLGQNKKKLADLKKIAQQSPATEQLTSREVVSVDQGGHRYLPPSTQMVATQVVLTDTKLDINETERKLKINRVKLQLFTGLKNALEAGDYSDSFFEHLTGLKDEFFQGKDLKRDEILIVHNEVFADFALFKHRFNDVMQFISGPTLPQRAKPSKRIVVAITFFLGLFFFTLLAFFLEFIQRGQQRERKEVVTRGKRKVIKAGSGSKEKQI